MTSQTDESRTKRNSRRESRRRSSQEAAILPSSPCIILRPRILDVGSGNTASSQHGRSDSPCAVPIRSVQILGSRGATRGLIEGGTCTHSCCARQPKWPERPKAQRKHVEHLRPGRTARVDVLAVRESVQVKVWYCLAVACSSITGRGHDSSEIW